MEGAFSQCPLIMQIEVKSVLYPFWQPLIKLQPSFQHHFMPCLENNDIFLYPLNGRKQLGGYSDRMPLCLRGVCILFLYALAVENIATHSLKYCWNVVLSFKDVPSHCYLLFFMILMGFCKSYIYVKHWLGFILKEYNGKSLIIPI